MKRKGRIWFFIIFILTLLFTYTAVMGITTQYGDITTTVVRPLNEIDFGSDISGEVNLILKPDAEADLSEANMLTIKSILQTRLANAQVTDFGVDYNVKTNDIYISFALPTGKNVQTAEEIVQDLLKINNFTMRRGSEVNADGTPAGETAENIVFSSSDVVSATPETGVIDFLSGDSSEEEYITLELGTDAQNNYTNIINELQIESGATISFWLDDVMVSSVEAARYFGLSIMGSGAPTILGNDFTKEDTENLTKILTAGKLPFSVNLNTYNTNTTVNAPNNYIVIAAAIALAMTAVIYMFVFRLPGFISAISLLGQAAFIIALITKYFNVFSSHLLTKPGIAAFFVSMAIGTLSGLLINSRLKRELRSGKKLEVSIKAAFSWKNIAPIVDTSVLMLIASLIIMGGFANSSNFFAILMKPALFMFDKNVIMPVYSFGYVLFWGATANLIFGLFTTWAMLVSISKTKIFSSTRLYGAMKEGREPKEVKPASAVKRYKLFMILPALILVAAIALPLTTGVTVDENLKEGLSASYSYKGDIDTSNIFTESDIATLGVKPEYTAVAEDIVYGKKIININLPGVSDISVLQKLGEILNSKYTNVSFIQLEANIVSATEVTKNALRSVVVFVAGYLLMLLYIALRVKRFKIKKSILPIILIQISALISAFIAVIAFKYPLGVAFVPVALVLCAYSLFMMMVVIEKTEDNKSLYGKKLSIAETGNLSLAQIRGRMLLSVITISIFMFAVSMFAWWYGTAGILLIALPIWIGVIVISIITYFVAAPWWIIRSNKSK